MLKRIKNKIDSMLEKIGFHYVGYKIYITEIMKDIKQLKRDINSIEDVDANSIKDDVLYEIEYKIDEVQEELDSVKSDLEYVNGGDLINELDKRVKLLEGLAFTGDDNVVDDKIDNIINDGLIMEFANYITDNIDVFDYDYGDVKRSVVMALLECKQYKIKVERVK